MGPVLALLASQDPRYAFLGAGLTGTLFAQNIANAWTSKVAGPNAVGDQFRLLTRPENRTGFFLSQVGSAPLRSSPGLILVASAPADSPVTWLGYGILCTFLCTMGPLIRLTFFPPSQTPSPTTPV